MTETKLVNKEGTAVARNFRVLPKTEEFAVATALVEVDKLREAATTHEAKVAAPGRKAMRAIMADVYALFCAASDNESDGKLFWEKVKGKLKALDVEVKSSSPKEVQLVRYIFKDFDDKQVSVYGRSLAVAYSLEVNPDEFAAWIEKSGGFEGVRQASVASGKKPTSPLESALSRVRSEEVVETVPAVDWDEDEEFRVMVAVRNDDGDEAGIRHLPLRPARALGVLKLYTAEVAEQKREHEKAKSAKREVSLAEQQRLLNLRFGQEQAHAAAEAAKAAVDKAKGAGDPAAMVAAKETFAKAQHEVKLADLKVESCRAEHAELFPT